MKRYTIIIQMFLIAAVGMQAQVEVVSEIDSAQICIGSQAHLNIRVTAADNARVVFPSYEPQKEMQKGIEVVEIQGDTLKASGNRRTIQRTYTLTSWDEKKYRLATQKIKVNGKTYHTKPLNLEVLAFEADSLDDEHMSPARDILDNPFSWKEWAPLALLLLLAILLMAVAYYLKTQRGGNNLLDIRKPKVKKLLPHEKAMAEISRIKEEQLEQSEDQKAYYTRLTDVLREYLEERFNINAMEMTSADIIYRLRQEENQEKIDELREVFETADLVKFAKYSALRNENDLYMAHVEKFIEETKQSDMAVDESAEMHPSAEEMRQGRMNKMRRVAVTTLVVIAVLLLVYVGWQSYELLS